MRVLAELDEPLPLDEVVVAAGAPLPELLGWRVVLAGTAEVAEPRQLEKMTISKCFASEYGEDDRPGVVARVRVDWNDRSQGGGASAILDLKGTIKIYECCCRMLARRARLTRCI